MEAFMTVLVDELLWGETEGFRTVDHSKGLDDPDRVFWLKVILLFWVGDYPGLAKCAAMKHSGFYACHWCKGFFFSHSPGHNVCIHNRRNLRPNHPYRTDARWGPHETRGPSPLRTRDEVESQSRDISNMKYGSNPKKKMQKSTGIDGFCLLLLLSMFDIVWDMLPDMMHITKGLFSAIYSALFVFSAVFSALFVFSALSMLYNALLMKHACRFVEGLDAYHVPGRDATRYAQSPSGIPHPPRPRSSVYA